LAAPGDEQRYVGHVKSLGFVVLLAGCGFQSAPAQVIPDADPGADAPIVPPDVAVVVPPDARVCFGNFFEICLSSAPSNDVSFPGTPLPLDTGIDSNCTQVVPQTGGPPLCVIAGRSVMVSGALVAIGVRPLVLIGTETVAIQGTLDASSKQAGARRGAGGSTGACSTLVIAGLNDTGGAGGGAGGGLGTAGGSGGDGDTNNNGAPAGPGLGGIAGLPPPAPTVLRGGCAGGEGGDGDATHLGGPGGHGGGAIYVIAGTSITVPGNLFASGAGGGATPSAGGSQQGGGGGGAGGMIVLDAPTVDVPGRVVANGGAGGAGGNLESGGTPGGDGTTLAWNTRATAGDAPRDGGAGAPGSAVGQTGNLSGRDEFGGGGGGGGGLGLVYIYGTLQNGTQISPAPLER
jgi:hypothetical protein